MIIRYCQKTGIDSWKPLWNYLMKPEDNPFVLAGDTDILDLAYERAAKIGHPVQIRHFVLAPGEPTPPEDIMWCVDVMAEEWDFNPYEALVVEHNRLRKGEGTYPFHYHIAVPEVDARLRIMCGEEKHFRCCVLSRLMEAHLGHQLQPHELESAYYVAALKNFTRASDRIERHLKGEEAA